MNAAEQLVKTLLESDPKDLAMRAATPLSPDTIIVFEASFTDVGPTAPVPHVTLPNYYSDDLGDWQPDWNEASKFRLGDYIQDGVLDANDFPFGTEYVIAVNPDGSPGQKHTLTDLDMGTAEVIDTYVSQEQDFEDDRDLNPENHFPRARRGAAEQHDPGYDADMENWNPPDA